MMEDEDGHTVQTGAVHNEQNVIYKSRIEPLQELNNPASIQHHSSRTITSASFYSHVNIQLLQQSPNMYASILVALAAVAAAMPAPQVTAGSGPDKSQEFAIAAKIGGTVVSLTAAENGTSTERVLVAGRPAAFPGTPAYANVQGKYTSINLDIDGEIFGLHVTPVVRSIVFDLRSRIFGPKTDQVPGQLLRKHHHHLRQEGYPGVRVGYQQRYYLPPSPGCFQLLLP
jgi:hypothetical protein